MEEEKVLNSGNNDVLNTENNLNDEDLEKANKEIDRLLKKQGALIRNFGGSRFGKFQRQSKHLSKYTKPKVDHRKKNKLERKRKQELRAKSRRK